MKRSCVVSAVVATVALSSSLFAQWPLYPYADAPRMPDGTLNLAAPAPRAVDGKPDLSGVWMARSTGDPNGEPGRPPRANFGNSGVGFKDFVTGKWKGEATAVEDFGDPTTTDRYALCLYDETSATPALVFEKEIPVGGTCDGEPCWSTATDGLQYVGGPAKPTSIRSVDLRAGADGKARILVRASGIAAGPPPRPIEFIMK